MPRKRGLANEQPHEGYCGEANYAHIAVAYSRGENLSAMKGILVR